jgi:5-hydroxyisourate hydrolase
MHGVPAQGVRIQLYRLDGDARTLLKEVHTNADGRCDRPLLEGDAFPAGSYELVFHAGDYFAAKGVQMAQPRFVDQVVLRFGVAHAAESYHVPLVVTPWAWSTYRGS